MITAPKHQCEKNCSSNFLITLLRRKSIAVWIGKSYMEFHSWLTGSAVHCYCGQQYRPSRLLPLRHQGVSGRLELLIDTHVIFCNFSFQLYQQTDPTHPHKASLEQMQWKDWVRPARQSKGEDALIHQQHGLRSVCTYHETTLLTGQCLNGLE